MQVEVQVMILSIHECMEPLGLVVVWYQAATSLILMA